MNADGSATIVCQLGQSIALVQYDLSMWRDARARARGTDAPDFNVFDFLRTDELGLSDVLRWLLDPQASHGQGITFLELFRSQFNIAGDFDSTCAATRTEVVIRDKRRLDVLVECGGFALVIENKPYAGWQPRQVRDYLAHLRSTYSGGHCLVLLKGESGELPAEQLSGSERQRLIDICELVDTDYLSLRDWLLLCAEHCQSPRIRSVFADFARYVHENFGGGGDMEEAEEICRSITSSAASIETAIRIIDAREAIFTKLMDALVAALRSRAVELGWVVSTDTSKGVYFSPGKQPILIHDGKANFLFVFDINKEWRNHPYIGLISRHRLERAAKDVLWQELDARFGSDPDSRINEWPWYHYLRADEMGVEKLENANVWARLHRPDEVAELVTRLARDIFSFLASRSQLEG